MTLQRNRVLALLMALMLAIGTLGTAPAHADAKQDSVSQAADWLATTWKEKPGQYFAAGTIADGILALSAAEAHPDVVESMLRALHEKTPSYVGTPDAKPNPAGQAKIIITLLASNQDPRTFLPGRDLVAELVDYAKANSQDTKDFWAPYLIAIALSRAGEQVPQSVIDNMLANQQDGAFGYTYNGKFNADPDYTGIGIMAMNLLSTEAPDRATRNIALDSALDAIDWAQNPANQKTDANGNTYWATYSSANSTGMVAGGLAEAGENIESPVAYLVDQQKKTGTGAWSNVHDGTRSDVMATTQAIFAPAGKGYATIKSTQVKPINFNPAPDPEPRKPATADVAKVKPVGVPANIWGTVDTDKPVKVWTEVKLPNGTWSKSQERTTNANGYYVIPLTYGLHTAGTLSWRVAVQHAVGDIEYTPTVEQRRVVSVTASTAGRAAVGTTPNVWGTARGASNARVWTEVKLPNGTWSKSQERTTNANGYYVIPLTYGLHTAGTLSWRVAVQSGSSVVRSAPFNFQRVATVTSASAGTAAVGTTPNVWGTARGASNARVWTEVKLPNGTWSRSQERTTNANGYYVIPLTYGKYTAGTTTWRVGVQVGNTITYGAAFNFVRR
uniref:hypothetical protein n=1 Tax=Tessaracoccus timonensis TaxID=2161816 RepID=UPI000D560A0F|nr:hypothetical protein [Tessaracoccus timonensis]